MSQTKAQLIEGLNINTSAPADALVIDSSGNVGIGTTSPSSPLHLKNSNANFRIESTSTTGASVIQFGDPDDIDVGSLRYEHNGNALRFITNASEAMRIDSSGRVGIGSTAPGHNLEVKGSFPDFAIVDSDTTNDKFRILHNGGATQLQVDPNNVSSSSHFLVAVDGSEAMRIDSSGRVGIGTTSPTELLHIRKDDTAVVAIKAQNNSSNGIMEYQAGNDADNWFFGIGSDDAFGISDVTGQAGRRLTITQAGNVGIGTSSPGGTLHVDASGGATVRVSRISANASKYGQLEHDGTNTTLTSTDNLLFNVNSSERMRIDSSGNVGVGLTPGVKFDVDVTNSALRVKSDTSAAQILITSDDNASAKIEFGDESDNDRGAITYDNPNNALIFQANASERMRIDSLGNVAIGTSTIGSAPLTLYSSASRTMYQGSSTGTGNGNGFTTGNNGGANAFVWNYENGFMQFATNNTERMRIDSSGRLLIGTTTSEAFIGTPSTLQIEGTSDATTRISLFRTSNDNSANALIFAKARNTSHAILNNNDLIGKIEWFGADGNDTNQRAASIAVAVDGAPSGNDMPGRLTFSTTADGASSPSERMRIDQGGRVLVGESLSSRTSGGINCHLHVEGTGANGSSLTLIRNTNGATNPPYLFFGKTRSSSTGGTTAVQNGDLLGYLGWQGADGNDLDGTAAAIQASVDGTPGSNDMPGRLEFQTTRDGNNSPSKSMVLNRNGELRIGYGNSDPVSTDHVHSIGDPELNSVTTNLARLVIQERSGNWLSFKDGGGTHYGTISRNPPGVTYGSNSDYRLKENVENFTNGITLVKQLRPVTFNWNELSGFDTTLTVRGFLAHEVQDVEPNAVVGDKDEMDRYGDCYDAEGRKTQVNVFEHQAKEGETWTYQSEDIRHQQLDPAKLVPILTAALQEAITKIETLETSNADLLARVTALEG